jgi:hypothetical protein
MNRELKVACSADPPEQLGVLQLGATTGRQEIDNSDEEATFELKPGHR